MTNPWFKLWSQSFEIASGAPEVIRKRLTMFQAAPQSPQSLIESNRMVVEKMAAMNESMWSLWRDSMSMRWPGPPSARFTPARAAAKALKPISTRVRANRKRLK